jgi:hypothetical protein
LNLFSIRNKCKKTAGTIKKPIFSPVKKGWVKIFSTTDLQKAEIMRVVLEENGIPCVVINKKDSSYLTFGEIELYVQQEDSLNALRIIEQN